jgi:hypothetical protein
MGIPEPLLQLRYLRTVQLVTPRLVQLVPRARASRLAAAEQRPRFPVARLSGGVGFT